MNPNKMQRVKVNIIKYKALFCEMRKKMEEG